MSDNTTVAKKKLTALEQLNQNASLYGQQQLTEDELRSFQFTRNSVSVAGSPAQEYRERLTNMMMIDVATAKELGEDYQDLMNEAEAKMKSIDDTAKLSGAEKVKKDFFGSKRREARRQLEAIKGKQTQLAEGKRLEAEREKREEEERVLREKERIAGEIKDKYKDATNASLKARNDKIKEFEDKRDAETNEFRKRAIQAKLDGINGRVIGTNHVSNLTALQRLTDHEIKAWKIQQVFIKRKALTKFNPMTKKGVNVFFPESGFVRDMSRFKLKLDFGTGKPQEMEDQEKELTPEQEMAQLEEMATDLHIFADEIYICAQGRHATTTFDENGNPAPVDEETKKEAFLDCSSRLAEKVPEIKEFQKKYPAIFKEKPSLDDLVASYQDMKLIFNTLQTCSIICDGIMKGEAIKLVGDKEREEFIKTSVYLRSMKQFVDQMSFFCQNTFTWCDKLEGEQPMIGQESYKNYNTTFAEFSEEAKKITGTAQGDKG